VPPKGDDPHRYVFTLFGLSRPLALEVGASVGELKDAVPDTLLAQGRPWVGMAGPGRQRGRRDEVASLKKSTPERLGAPTLPTVSVIYIYHGAVRRARCRWLVEPGSWDVRARVERFIEPSLLLLLRDGPRHGYELAEAAGEHLEVDLGNLYRLLRGLEDEGVVTSVWRGDLPGPTRRTYYLTEAGRTLLDHWAEALRRTEQVIAAFLRRYEEEP
jgi:DNA-binding PadR family transcriptional regulator